MIHLALSGVDPDNWMGYLDDIFGFASEPWEHLEHMKPLVEAHLKAGIKIQPCKTKLFQDTVEYLRHKVSAQGVEMIPDYVERIKNWPVSTTCKEAATFLGFTGYYRVFIPKYSALTNRMNSLRKADKLVWTEDMDADFKELRLEFQMGRVQGYPYFHSDDCSG